MTAEDRKSRRYASPPCMAGEIGWFKTLCEPCACKEGYADCPTAPDRSF